MKMTMKIIKDMLCNETGLKITHQDILQSINKYCVYDELKESIIYHKTGMCHGDILDKEKYKRYQESLKKVR